MVQMISLMSLLTLHLSASLLGMPFNRTSDVGSRRLRSASSRSGRLGM